ncbi:hypothetical protein GCM10022254_16330 [Actinomadura meridiana]|uniref:Restriction endonuclease type IV Mrr domain-containing protein n=1 Tax=Actinomadura meridiana TaxID=559626 RepID=A0ABP8BVV4_9ACTN
MDLLIDRLDGKAMVFFEPRGAENLYGLCRCRGLRCGGVKETQVVDAFRRWLTSGAWTLVTPTDKHTDVEAVRGSERLICEAKGRTSAAGLDCDTAYGQLLRRMTDPSPAVRYAVVVPTSALTAALRVPRWVRDALRLTVYEVRDDLTVATH